MCTIVYKADDGKEFDNREDCLRYNSQTTIYLVEESLHNAYIGYEGKVLKAFESRALAEDFIKYDSTIERLDKNYEYKVRPLIVSDGGKYND